MGFNCCKASASPGMQFTFCKSSPRNSWCSFYRTWKDERLSQPFQHVIPGLGTQQISHQVIAPYRQDILMIIHSLNINKTYGQKSNDVPIHKKGDMQHQHNYQPVSLLPICSKFFARIIFKLIFKYLEKIASVQINLVFVHLTHVKTSYYCS